MNESDQYVRNVTGADVELDQRLRCAFDQSGENRSDLTVLSSLLKLNPSILRYLDVDTEFLSKFDSAARIDSMDMQLKNVLKQATQNTSHSLGVRDFLIALIEYGIEVGDDYAARPYSIDALAKALHGSVGTPLSDAPKVMALLDQLKSQVSGEEDFQFILTLQGDSVCFRVTSILDDYVQQDASGLFLPQRAILTHFKDQFGGFTTDEIEELEGLLNSKTTREADFQGFFERHPHFLRKWDHREVYPHVTLSRPEGDLIPDFILTDRQLQNAAILDLKLSTPKLITRRRNRDRFTASVLEARTQLLRYRDWFREPANRSALVEKFGMEIYEPKLIVIIGRSAEFSDGFDRQRLTADNPDLEVVTYDDILTYAQRRRMLIQTDMGCITNR